MIIHEVLFIVATTVIKVIANTVNTTNNNLNRIFLSKKDGLSELLARLSITIAMSVVPIVFVYHADIHVPKAVPCILPFMTGRAGYN